MLGGETKALEEFINQKMMGRKSGKGFYLYPQDSGKKSVKQINPEALEILKKFTKTKLKLSQEDIQNRMVLRFINEAVTCLQDEIIASPLDGDIGLVFGVGFPPFLGGPFRYVDSIGASKFCDAMLQFRDSKGPQFTPAPLLVEHSKSGKKFYP